MKTNSIGKIFLLKNMKEYELSKENFDLIFNQYSKYEFLDDEKISIHWEEFYNDMDGLDSEHQNKIILKQSY